MQSVHQFAEKVALVTDGAIPIGRAVALQLALQGSYVITAYSSLKQGATHAVDELLSLGTLAGAVEADVASSEGASIAVAEVERLFGRLDLLVNCLKFPSESSYKEGAEFAADAVEAEAARLVTGAAMRLMQSRPKPKIVNVGWSEVSTVADVTRSQAVELSDNFRANCVIVREGKANAEPAEFSFLRPASDVSPDDVARVITFLLSPESIALNGQILTLG